MAFWFDHVIVFCCTHVYPCLVQWGVDTSAVVGVLAILTDNPVRELFRISIDFHTSERPLITVIALVLAGFLPAASLSREANG